MSDCLIPTCRARGDLVHARRTGLGHTIPVSRARDMVEKRTTLVTPTPFLTQAKS
jgi:hypothetical protein